MIHIKTIEGEIYLALSECYKEPGIEFAEDVARGRLYETISRGLKFLDIPVWPETLRMLERGNHKEYGYGEGEDVYDVYKELKDEYYSLFFPLNVVPVESVYKEWQRGKKEKGYIMGDPAIEMKKRYEMLDIEIPQIYKDTPDHIALILEYVALLCENLPEISRSEFVLNHLDWVEWLHDDIYKFSQSDFYRSVADTTVAFIKNERNILMNTGR